MALNPTTLRESIVDGIDALSDSDKADRDVFWQMIAEKLAAWVPEGGGGGGAWLRGVHDDFHSTIATTATNCRNFYHSALASGTQSLDPSSFVSGAGVLCMSSSTSADSGAMWRTASSAYRIGDAGKIVFVFRPETLTDVAMDVGLHSRTSVAGVHGNGLFISITNNALTLKSANAGVIATTTNITLSLSWYRCEVSWEAGVATMRLYFAETGALAAERTLTITAPTTLNAPVVLIAYRTVATTASVLYRVDYLGFQPQEITYG